jgi:hypothetical protein
MLDGLLLLLAVRKEMSRLSIIGRIVAIALILTVLVPMENFDDASMAHISSDAWMTVNRHGPTVIASVEDGEVVMRYQNGTERRIGLEGVDK